MSDTIAAIATAAGVGGVGIVRLSGPQAVAIATAIVGRDLDREVRVAWARSSTGERIDQVIAFAMRAPHSFTGEDVAELHGHGGTQNLAALLRACLDRGARIAEPGEFTRRAVENGKLDLIRAEALLGVIHAGSERAWRQAQSALAGSLGARAVAIEARAVKLLAELEGRIDFPDADLDPASTVWIASELAAICAECETLAKSFEHGRAVDRGIVVALVGAVNVGKSSLLNALVGNERAIVDATPGTTRDYLEVGTTWDGIAVTLIDTAGIRTTEDPVERRGIELGEARVAAADVVLVVNDQTTTTDGSVYGERALLVRNKVDLDADLSGKPQPRSGSSEIVSGKPQPRSGSSEIVSGRRPIEVSAKTGVGLEVLRARVLETCGVAEREGSEDAFVTTARQFETVSRALAAFSAARSGVDEIVAIEVRTGVQALAQLRGVEVGERVLDELFARFCIGK